MREEGDPASLGLELPPGSINDNSVASAGMCLGRASVAKEHYACCCGGSY